MLFALLAVAKEIQEEEEMKNHEQDWKRPGDLVKAVQEEVRVGDEGFDAFLRSPEPEDELLLLLTELVILAKQIDDNDMHRVVSAYGSKILDCMSKTGQTGSWEWILSLGYPLYRSQKAEILQTLASMLYIALEDDLVNDVDGLDSLIRTNGEIVFESIRRNMEYWKNEKF